MSRPARLIAPLLLAASAAAWSAAGADVSTEEPRAYGYQVGDRFERRVRVQVPAAWQLDPTSLPGVRRGQPIELQRIERRSTTSGDTRQHEILLQYQVFLAPPTVRTLELAPWQLQFETGARRETLRVDAWPVTVAPLVPVAVSPRTGLGELQPDVPTPLIDTRPVQRRLALFALLALGLLAWLALVHLGPPWRAARRRPFGLACRQLRALPMQPGRAQWQAALRSLHEALNRTAGEVVFASALPEFVASHPGFAPLQAELARFLDRSRLEFFADAGTGPADGEAAWLLALARRLRDAERGLA